MVSFYNKIFPLIYESLIISKRLGVGRDGDSGAKCGSRDGFEKSKFGDQQNCVQISGFDQSVQDIPRVLKGMKCIRNSNNLLAFRHCLLLC